jgi:transcriptional regulator with XRE-family HTH domain
MKRSTKKDGLGPALRRLREAQGLKLSDVAPHIGTDSGSLSRIERGLRDPSLKQLAALAAVFGVPVVSLVRHVTSVPTRAV